MIRPSPALPDLTLRAKVTLLCLGLSTLSASLTSLGTTTLAVRRIGPVGAAAAAEVAAAEAVGSFRSEALVVLAAVLGVAAVASWIVAGRAIRPIRRITAVVDELPHDAVADEPEARGRRDELRTIAGSFNGVVDRLARAFEGQRLFVANASHELRTPLAVIRSAADISLAKPTRPEAEYRRALATIDQAVQRTERLLDSLLRLARAQHRQVGFEPVDLAAVARASVLPGAGRPVEVRDRLTSVVVAGDPNLLDLMVRNLVVNGIKYNVPSGWIAVTVERAANAAVVTVENTGLPVDPDRIPGLLRAFQRGDNARAAGAGSGLGLALVDAIVHAHGGRLTIRPRHGGGLRVVIRLPRIPDPDPRPSPVRASRPAARRPGAACCDDA